MAEQKPKRGWKLMKMMRSMERPVSWPWFFIEAGFYFSVFFEPWFVYQTGAIIPKKPAGVSPAGCTALNLFRS